MQDLKAMKLFRDVARAGGFSAAHRETGQSRATLSRALISLEEDLGTRLIERSTRSFRLTESGALFYDRVNEILTQLDEAVAMVEDRQREPRGLVQLAAPPSLLHLGIGQAILDYMEATPQVQVQIHVSNREVDIRHEGVDFVLRARTRLDYPLDFVPVTLARIETWLVVHPRWSGTISPTIEDTLTRLPVIAWRGLSGHSHWSLHSSSGETRDIPLAPRLIVDDIAMLRNAALAGMGLALIPRTYVAEDVLLGRLMRPKFDLQSPVSIVHAVHLGQRGMRPAVRHLLDWLKRKSLSLTDLPA